MRTLLIKHNGILHYALTNLNNMKTWFIYCDWEYPHALFRRDSLARGRSTCVRCLAEEFLRGKPLEDVDVD